MYKMYLYWYPKQDYTYLLSKDLQMMTSNVWCYILPLYTWPTLLGMGVNWSEEIKPATVIVLGPTPITCIIKCLIPYQVTKIQYYKTFLPRSMPNADQCRSKSWHWSELPLNADHCRSIPIIDWHWALIEGVLNTSKFLSPFVLSDYCCGSSLLFTV